MLRLLGFLHNRRVKLARLSALYTHNLYPKEIPLVHISVTGWVYHRAIVRPDRLRPWKIPMNPSRIEPATFHTFYSVHSLYLQPTIAYIFHVHLYTSNIMSVTYMCKLWLISLFYVIFTSIKTIFLTRFKNSNQTELLLNSCKTANITQNICQIFEWCDTAMFIILFHLTSFSWMVHSLQ